MNPELTSPIKTTISITNMCNLNCKYCYSKCTKIESADELSADEWKDVMDQAIDHGVIHFFVEGGEPLMRDDLFDILGHCKRRAMLWLRTNGTLMTRELAKKAKNVGVSTVMVDIHGAEAATHERVVGESGSHAKAIQAVKYCRELGIQTYMLMILNRHNKDEVQDYVNLAHQLGAAKVGILRLYPVGWARDRWKELALTLEEMKCSVSNVNVPQGIGYMQSWHPNDGNCCYQLSAISASGDSIGCPYLRDFVRYGNMRETTFASSWNHPLWRLLRRGDVKDACVDCGATQGSFGGCRSTAYAFTGDWEASDPFCEKSNNGIDLTILPDVPLVSAVAQRTQQVDVDMNARLSNSLGSSNSASGAVEISAAAVSDKMELPESATSDAIAFGVQHKVDPITSATVIQKKQGLRIRDVPEWKSAIVFDPDQTDLQMINMSSRLLIELCIKAKTVDELLEEYSNILATKIDKATAASQVFKGVSDLVRNRLVERL
ncbi:MAG: radical SAM protein [Pseudomonadota bacterium]